MSIDVAAPPYPADVRLPHPKTSSAHTTPRTDFEFDVAVVGLGYVGLPTALALHAAGAKVLGVDLSEHRLVTIRNGQADLLDSDRDRLVAAMAGNDFTISGSPTLLKQAAAVIICVPTPIDPYSTPDLTLLSSACATAVDVAVPGQLLILTSTTYAGCTRDMLVDPLERRGFTVGGNISVAFSPERIDPGNGGFTHEDVPRVVGGATEACRRAAQEVLGRYARTLHSVESLEAAEMTKLLENTFRAVNIALANEFADACTVLGLPVVDVIDAAATKPYGFMPFFPGPGVGGHCIPCDPHYLLWQLRKEHVSLPMIEQAMSEIAGRPRRVVARIREVLADNGKPIAGARVLVSGVAYKPDVADLRESPALEILHLLHDQGAHVAYHDRFFDTLTLHGGVELVNTTDPAGFGADLVLLHTDHTSIDSSWMSRAPLVLDATYRRTDLPNYVAL